MVWSKDPSPGRLGGQRSEWEPARRSVDVSLINLAGNKLDQFMPIQVAVGNHAAGSGTAVTMTIQVANKTPPGEP